MLSGKHLPNASKAVFGAQTSLEIRHALKDMLATALTQKYGEKLDERICRRVAEEWQAMERTDTVLDAAALYELVIWLKENEQPYWLPGAAGSSFILWLLGITSGNPLPPHYHCPSCHTVYWQCDQLDGFDLPTDQICEKDGAQLAADGHDIPWQVLFGYGTHRPVFNIYLPHALYEAFKSASAAYWRVQIGAANVACDDERQAINLAALHMDFCLDDETAAKTPEELLQGHGITGISSFADLIAAQGLIRSTGTWDEDIVFMNQRLGYAPSELIAFRDDIFRYLLDHGLSEEEAWQGMDQVRKGRAFPAITSEMQHARDKWVLTCSQKIKYLFPKAHCVEQTLFQIQK